MRVTILGSGTLVPDGRRGPAGYAVESGGACVLLDGGSGTLRRLAEAGLDFRAIDHLFYTHVHPDHSGELVPFLFAQRHTPGWSRRRPIHLYGPRGFAAFTGRLFEVYGRWLESDAYAIEVEELWETGTRVAEAALAVETRRMRHAVACVGYRLTGPAGETVAYTGDSDRTGAIVELARGAEVLISDCSTPDEHKLEGHLSPSPAGELAGAAGVRTLVLSHLYPVCDTADIVAQCRRQFSGEVIVAHDLMTLEVTPGAVRSGCRPPQVWPRGWAAPPA